MLPDNFIKWKLTDITQYITRIGTEIIERVIDRRDYHQLFDHFQEIDQTCQSLNNEWKGRWRTSSELPYHILIKLNRYLIKIKLLIKLTKISPIYNDDYLTYGCQGKLPLVLTSFEMIRLQNKLESIDDSSDIKSKITRAVNNGILMKVPYTNQLYFFMSPIQYCFECERFELDNLDRCVRCQKLLIVNRFYDYIQRSRYYNYNEYGDYFARFVTFKKRDKQNQYPNLMSAVIIKSYYSNRVEGIIRPEQRKMMITPHEFKQYTLEWNNRIQDWNVFPNLIIEKIHQYDFDHFFKSPKKQTNFKVIINHSKH